MQLPPDSLGKQPVEEKPLEAPSVESPKEKEVPAEFQKALNELTENLAKLGLEKQFPPEKDVKPIDIKALAEELAKELESSTEEILARHAAEETPPEIQNELETIVQDLESSTEEILAGKDEVPKKTPPPVPDRSLKPKLTSRNITVENPIEEMTPEIPAELEAIERHLESSTEEKLADKKTPLPSEETLEGPKKTPDETKTAKSEKGQKSWKSHLPNIGKMFGGSRFGRASKKKSPEVEIRHNVSVGLPQRQVKKGVDLQTLLLKAGVTAGKSTIPDETVEIPSKQKKFIDGLITALRENHLHDEGITRLAGKDDQTKELRKKFEHYANNPNELTGTDPHTLAAALKRELRMRSNLFGKNDLEKLLKIGEGQLNTDAEGNILLTPDEISAFNEMGIEDGHPNADIIRNLLELCVDIIKNKEANKMGLDNVIMTLSPTIIVDDYIFEQGNVPELMKNRTHALMKLLAYHCLDSDVELKTTSTVTTESKIPEPSTPKLTPEGIRQLEELRQEIEGTTTPESTWKTSTIKTDTIAIDSLPTMEVSAKTTAPSKSLNIDHKERIEKLIVDLKDGKFEDDIEAAISSLVGELGSGRPIFDKDDIAVMREIESSGSFNAEDREKIAAMVMKLPPNNRNVLNQVLDLCLGIKNSEKNNVDISTLGKAMGPTLFSGEEKASGQFAILLEYREILNRVNDLPDQISQMIDVESLNITDVHFLGSFLDIFNRVSISAGKEALGEDFEHPEDADIGHIYQQASDLAMADAMVQAYERLSGDEKVQAKNNINQLTSVGRIPQRVFSLFCGRVDSGLVPDIPPRQITEIRTQKSIQDCVTDMRTLKKKDRASFAQQFAKDLQQYQLQKYEKLDLNQLTAANSMVHEIGQFNQQLAEFCKTCILTGGMTGEIPNTQEVRRIVKSLALIADHAIQNGDYATAFSIGLAFSDTQVEGVMNDVLRFDPKGSTLPKIELAKSLVDPFGNYKTIRSHMKNNGAPVKIPACQVLWVDLTLSDEQPDTDGKKILPIKVEARQIVFADVTKVQDLQVSKNYVHVAYNLDRFPPIMSEASTYNMGIIQRKLAGKQKDRNLYGIAEYQTAFKRLNPKADLTKGKDLKAFNKFMATAIAKKHKLAIYNPEDVEKIVNAGKEPVEMGKDLAHYFLQAASNMTDEDKMKFLEIMSSAKGSQANLAKGFVEVLLAGNRQHFPLLKDILQLSFNQDIQESISDPTTLLRHESIGTRMASQAYLVLGKDFREMLTSKLKDILPEGSLEIQANKLAESEREQGDALISSRQTQLLAMTGVVYATLTENIDKMPPEMKELFQMVHDEVEAAGFGEEASRKAYNSQMYLRFISRVITDTAAEFTGGTDVDKNKRRACILISKIVQNHANELESSQKEPYMEFMFSESGEKLRENMMNLTHEMAGKKEKPKAKIQLGAFVKTAVRGPGWGAKKKATGAHRPRSMSAETLGVHRKQEGVQTTPTETQRPRSMSAGTLGRATAKPKGVAELAKLYSERSSKATEKLLQLHTAAREEFDYFLDDLLSELSGDAQVTILQDLDHIEYLGGDNAAQAKQLAKLVGDKISEKSTVISTEPKIEDVEIPAITRPTSNVVVAATKLAQSYTEASHQNVIHQLNSLLDDAEDPDALIFVFSQSLGDELAQFLVNQVEHEFVNIDTKGVKLEREAYKLLDKNGLAYKIMKDIFEKDCTSESKQMLLGLGRDEFRNFNFESFVENLPATLMEGFREKYQQTMEMIRSDQGILPNDAEIRGGAQATIKCLLFSFFVEPSWTNSENENERQLAEWFKEEFPGFIDFEPVASPKIPKWAPKAEENQ